ncbi:hypothetical protein [Myxococcus llanfairpwllgwyngyllgogerychwyrndrobwllllantysiliogogogochensis]|uniref:hypothetical protein n=1 Tax=Myxococcus llanfairpwllgwyngyllgogerychwyrndrobwllllantysiliogogogochensis TaxID=2590453 RepID=UPI0015F0814E|nr:hypothetical protein [Myxococcus llanfairpwllgwyngyllgogerychwyrndrobwllllantysiliogogogochensis]
MSGLHSLQTPPVVVSGLGTQSLSPGHMPDMHELVEPTTQEGAAWASETGMSNKAQTKA